MVLVKSLCKGFLLLTGTPHHSLRTLMIEPPKVPPVPNVVREGCTTFGEVELELSSEKDPPPPQALTHRIKEDSTKGYTSFISRPFELMVWNFYCLAIWLFSSRFLLARRHILKKSQSNTHYKKDFINQIAQADNDAPNTYEAIPRQTISNGLLILKLIFIITLSSLSHHL